MPDYSYTPMAPASTGVGRIVRGWKIKFSGTQNENIDEFLQRVEECRLLHRLSDRDVLAALFELMAGVALYWTRQHRHEWPRYAHFVLAARTHFGVNSDLQVALRHEAERRTQGEGEPVINYVTCVRAILDRLRPRMTPTAELDLIFRNLHPDLGRVLRRSTIQSLNVLIEQAKIAEGSMMLHRSYRPPPSPKESVMPECAFRHATNSKGSVAAVTTNPLGGGNIKEQVAKAIAERFEEIQKAWKKKLEAKAAQNSGKPKSPPKKPDEKTTTTPTAEVEREPEVEGGNKSSQKPPSTKPKDKLFCWDCRLPDYTRRTCPNCNPGKDKGGES